MPQRGQTQRLKTTDLTLTQHCEARNPPKFHVFTLAMYSSSCILPSRGGSFSTESHLEGTKFLFAIGCLLKIALGLGVGAYSTSFISRTRTPVDTQCRPSAYYLAFCAIVCDDPVDLEDLGFGFGLFVSLCV